MSLTHNSCNSPGVINTGKFLLVEWEILGFGIRYPADHWNLCRIFTLTRIACLMADVCREYFDRSALLMSSGPKVL